MTETVGGEDNWPGEDYFVERINLVWVKKLKNALSLVFSLVFSVVFALSVVPTAFAASGTYDVCTTGPISGEFGDVITLTNTQICGSGVTEYQAISSLSWGPAPDYDLYLTLNRAGTATETWGGNDVTITSVQPAPTISSVSPNSGSTIGGTFVSIRGQYFTGTTSVTFGGVAADNIYIHRDDHMTLSAPAHAAGPVDVVVTTPSGNGTASNAFTYVVITPTISSVSPAQGPAAGGANVVISGSDLTGATDVTFGGTSAASFTVDNDSQITATTPAHATGVVDIVVVSPYGNATASSSHRFVEPDIASVSTTSGSVSGGTTVVLTGSDFTGVSSVTFGGTAAASFHVDNDGQITAVTPAHASGQVNIVVTSSYGSGVAVNGFTYIEPKISSVSPNFGPAAGETTVTLTGSGLAGATGVSFGGTAAASFNVDSDSQITAVTPAHASGLVDVVVTSPYGNATAAKAYTFVEPGIASITPNSGTATGGTSVTINGSYLSDASAVTFDGVDATSFTVDSDTQITAITPPHAVGLVDVMVTTPSGSATVAGGYTYFEPTFEFTPTSGDLPEGAVDEVYSQPITVSGGIAPYTFSAIGLPEGMSIDAETGAISGMPIMPGIYTIEITARDQASFSGTVSYRFTVGGVYRPDPTNDVEVIGLVNAQVQSAKRFVTTQTRNFNDRLERLHNDQSRGSNAINVKVALPMDNTAPKAAAFAEDNLAATGSDATDQNSDEDSNANAQPLNTLFENTAFWAGGLINIGSNERGGIDFDHTLVGVSGGVDHRFSKHFVAGIGFGLAREKTDIGTNGTENTGEAYTAAVYASFHPAPFYIDGLLAASKLDFESSRYVTLTGRSADGEQDGQQVFGSVSAGYEYRKNGLLLSPYGRFEAAFTKLDGFIETGAGPYNLSYGEQKFDILAGAAGMRSEVRVPTQWSVFNLRGRVEYTHDFADSSRASIGYADLGTMPYTLELDAYMRDFVTVGLGIDTQINEMMSLSADYDAAIGFDSSEQEHVFGIRLERQF